MDVLTKAYPTIPLSGDSELVRRHQGTFKEDPSLYIFISVPDRKLLFMDLDQDQDPQIENQ